MPSLKILYIASEIAPCLDTTVANYVRELATAMHDKELDIRIFAPKFGRIHDRKNRLHEVIRLSGATLTIGSAAYPLSVKVTSIPNLKVQVYFIANQELFQGSATYHDENDNFIENNDIRSIFFCRGTLETVKKLEWKADVIHCHGWFSSFAPMYLRTIYRTTPLFKQAKIVTTLYNTTFKRQFNNVIEKAKMEDINDHDLVSLLSGDFSGFIKTAMQYSDRVLSAEPLTDPPFVSLCNETNIPYIPWDKNVAETHYKLYNQKS